MTKKQIKKRDRKEYSKNYYIKNKDRILKRNDKWQKENSERVLENSRKYGKNNKKKINKYRNEKLKIERRIQAWSQYHREKLIKNLGKKCKVCGSKNRLELHHEEYIHNFDKIHLLCKKHHEELHKRLRRKNAS